MVLRSQFEAQNVGAAFGRDSIRQIPNLYFIPDRYTGQAFSTKTKSE
jgi:hypothetical protein